MYVCVVARLNEGQEHHHRAEAADGPKTSFCFCPASRKSFRNRNRSWKFIFELEAEGEIEPSGDTEGEANRNQADEKIRNARHTDAFVIERLEKNWIS